MKEYFTIYLPVEGEIKGEGETVLLKSPHPIDQLRNVYRKRMQNYWNGSNWDNECETFSIDKNPECGAGFVHIHEIQLAKLFLCSRDIQVRDEYTSLEWELRKKKRLTKTEEYDSSEDKFKIVGEISPKATWVTEGMEFTADELAVPATEEGNFHILSTVIHLDGPGREPYCTYLVRDSEGNFH
jgi:hypothetical protein